MNSIFPPEKGALLKKKRAFFLESITVLAFRPGVQANPNLSFLFCFALGLWLSFTLPVKAQEAGTEISLEDRIEITRILLEEKFSPPPRETVFISTKNLSEELQNKFPKVKNLDVRFLSPAEAADSDACVYEFGEFVRKYEFVGVSFGDCREGLSFTFKKYGSRWRSILLIIERSDAP